MQKAESIIFRVLVPAIDEENLPSDPPNTECQDLGIRRASNELGLGGVMEIPVNLNLAQTLFIPTTNNYE